MSSHGKFTMEVPHICGETIPVEVSWSYWPGSYLEPPDSDTQWDCPDKCPKCGVELVHDDLFQRTAERIENETEERGEYTPGDEEDYDPPDYGDEMPF